MKRQIIIWLQWVTTWVSAALNNLFLSPKVMGLEHLKCLLCAKEHEKVSVVFVANHLSEIDPFVITGFLKTVHKLTLFPITFLAKKELHKYRLTDWFMTLLGCIPVGFEDKTERTASIYVIKKILDNKETLFLFPEGRMMKGGNFGQDKKGIRMFCRFSKVIVIPVRIQGLEPLATRGWQKFGRKLWQLVCRRRKLIIIFGRPVVLPQAKDSGFDAVELIKAMSVPVCDMPPCTAKVSASAS